MAGIIRLSNTGTGNGQSTITTAASGDVTYTLPSGGGTFVTTASTQALTVPFASGTAAAPSVTFLSDTDTGLYSPGANQVAIATSGTGRLFADANGSIIINTSSARANITESSRPSFQIEGTSYAAALASICRVSDSAAAAATVVIARTRGSSIGSNSSVQSGDTLGRLSFEGNNGTAFYGSASITAVAAETPTSTSAAGHLLFNTTPAGVQSSTERLRITSDGKVGIGLSTPAEPLHVHGAIRFGSVSPGTGGAGAIYGDGNNISIEAFNASDVATKRNVCISPYGGNVGINTTSPSQKLHIADSSAAFTRYESGSFDGYIGQRSTGILEIAQAQAGNITLLTNGAERARIDSSGRLLVGTSTVVGTNGQLGVSAGTNEGIVITNSTGATRYPLVFLQGTTYVGSVSTTGSATAYNTSSDYRLKENIVAVTDGITRLQQLKPSRFNFIADPTKTVDGFIAHEVQTVVPEAITGEKDAVDDNGNAIYQGIDQSKLVPLLTAALQEAVAKIESLEARLTAAGI